MRLPVQETLVFRSIADGTRRKIIEALAERPRPVHEVAALFDISRPAVSKHLRILGEAGLVEAVRVGKENIYELNLSALEEVRDWLARFWAGRLSQLKDLSERKH